MKTKYKFIRFVKITGDDTFYRCDNRRNDFLGYVEYYKAWKCHVFYEVDEGCILSASCLDDISHFLKQLDADE